MSLVCTETGKYIMYGSPLYCGTPRDGKSICALSQEVIDRIPVQERRTAPCSTATDGIDIFETMSGENSLTGAYTWSEMEKGKFLFSISPETAQRYTLRLWAECRPGHQQETVPWL